jgi:hypothetical protein
MKKNFRSTLGTVTFTSIFLLFNFHMSSCKERNISPINNPNLGIQASELIQAGSTIQVVCVGNLSCDTSGTHQTGGTKIVMQCTIPNSIQANTTFRINILDPSGNPIKSETLNVAKE